VASCLIGSCAEVQMGYNVLTYDTAIADTGNELLLLNAVRASQHFPRSFTSVGQLVAGPPLTASLASTLNFTALAGLQTYSVNPAAQASPGYSQFSLGNLNAQQFMASIRKPVSSTITQSFFQNPSWPKQLLDLIYLQNLQPSAQTVRSIDAARKAKCAAPTNSDTASRCQLMNEQIAEFAPTCGGHFSDIGVRMHDFEDDPGMYYNTAVNYCHYNRFRIFLEEAILIKWPICSPKQSPGCLRAIERSPLDMIGYLGELIAAQNYINEPFVPQVMFGRSTETSHDYVDVPLFVVLRGPPGNAAVTVLHDRVTYYIPRPDFGSGTEARSLQTLELVLQTVQAATNQNDLPKPLPTVAIKQ
jgi:hypothetical protein